MPKEFKEINFSVQPLQMNFASLDQILRDVAINQNGAVESLAYPHASNEVLRNRVARLNAHKQRILTQLEGYKNLPTANAARVDALRKALTNTENRLNVLNNERRASRIMSNPAASAQLAGQIAEINAKRNQLIALGVDPANLTTRAAIDHELRIRNLAPVANVSKAAKVAQVASPVAPVVAAKPVAANAFDRAMGRLGGVAKRHPVMATLAGLAAIGGAVRISNAKESGRIDPDSYYIMDNNSMSMVPRAFPSREAASYIRDDKYPGCAVNKGTTLLGKA